MKKANDKLRSEKDKSGAAIDVAVDLPEKRGSKPSKNPKDVNPNHRADFEDLLTKAVTPPKK